MFKGLKNLIFPTEEGLNDDEFWNQSLKTNISRIKVVVLATIIIEIAVSISLFIYQIGKPLGALGKYYVILYSIFIIVSIVFYIIIRVLEKKYDMIKESTLVIYGYTIFVVGWTMALSFVDGDTSTYVIAVMAVGFMVILKPKILFSILFIMQLILFALIPFYIPEANMLDSYINTSVAVVISFISGHILFKSILSNYVIHKEINSKSKEVERVNTELNKANEKLEYLSQTDGLTGIYNRRMFDDISEKFWNECIAEDKNLTVIMIDIDHFKIYNDTYGHIQGDECLRKIVSEMKRIIPDECLLARYGGEEFAVLIKGVTKAKSEAFADEIREGIEVIAVEHKNSPVQPLVTLSVGVFCGKPKDESSIINYIHRADNALFEAKEGGRNLVIAG